MIEFFVFLNTLLMNQTPLISRFWIISILLICLSCGKKETSRNELFSEKKFNYSDFENKKELSSEIYRWDSILSPYGIMVKGDKLIVSSLRTNYGLFQIEKKSMKIERKFGKIGFGPDEIPDVWQLDPGLNENSIWVFSFGGKEFVRFPLYEDTTSYLKKIKLKDQTIQTLSMNWIGSNRWVGYQNLGDSRFRIYDTLQTEISSLGPWSPEKPLSQETTFVLSQLNQGPVSLSPNKEILVLAQVNTDSFEIINLENNELRKIIGPLDQNLEYTIEYDGNNAFPYIDPSMRNGYNQIQITDKFIYLVFIGKSEDEINQTGSISNDIFVFDHEGNPKIHYMLDRSIRSIAVDEDARKIYAVSFEENPGVAVFNY